MAQLYGPDYKKEATTANVPSVIQTSQQVHETDGRKRMAFNSPTNGIIHYLPQEDLQASDCTYTNAVSGTIHTARDGIDYAITKSDITGTPNYLAYYSDSTTLSPSTIQTSNDAIQFGATAQSIFSNGTALVLNNNANGILMQAGSYALNLSNNGNLSTNSGDFVLGADSQISFKESCRIQAADESLMMAGTNKLKFGDANCYIDATSSGVTEYYAATSHEFKTNPGLCGSSPTVHIAQDGLTAYGIMKLPFYIAPNSEILYVNTSGQVLGSPLTASTIPMASASAGLADSVISQSGTNIGIGGNPTETLEATGSSNLRINANTTGAAGTTHVGFLMQRSGVSKWLLGTGISNASDNFEIYDYAAPAGTRLTLTHTQLTVGAGVLIMPTQAATASAPAYVKGGLYFDTTLNKLRIGGATAWETVTSS
jgi:hypothetical protein